MPVNGKKIVVIGGAGLIGSHTVDKLITLLVAIATVRALTPDWAKGKGKGPKSKSVYLLVTFYHYMNQVF